MTIAAPIPFAQVAMDVMDMPPTIDGYDGIHANLDTAELGYTVPVEPGYLHACMPPDLARLGQEASTSRIYSKVVGNGVYKGRKC